MIRERHLKERPKVVVLISLIFLGMTTRKMLRIRMKRKRNGKKLFGSQLNTLPKNKKEELVKFLLIITLPNKL